jgi:hypothetical protein
VSTADYQRRWRARHGARTGKPGRPVSAGCGTLSAYRRHLRHGEQPCAACRAANAAASAESYYARRELEG